MLNSIMSAIKSCYPIKSYNLRENYQSTKTADLHQCWDNWENKEQSELAKTALHRLKECHANMCDELDLSGLELSSLPSALPPSVRHLNLQNNALNELPVMRNGVITLAINNNHFSRLPNLEDTLSLVIIHDNPLEDIPDSVENLMLTCLNNQELEERQRFIKHFGAKGVANVSDANLVYLHNSLVKSLPKDFSSMISVVKYWMSEPADIEKWSQAEYKNNSLYLKKFLTTLSETDCSLEGRFKQQVSTLLIQATHSPELIAKINSIAQQSDIIHERACVTLNKLSTAALIEKVLNGDFDHQLTQLISLGRQFFRQECLEQLSNEKNKTFRLTAKQQVEFSAAYLSRLSEDLKLTPIANELMSPMAKKINNADVKKMLNSVKARENADFLTWLAKWEPWRIVLKTVAPLQQIKFDRKLHKIFLETHRLPAKRTSASKVDMFYQRVAQFKMMAERQGLIPKRPLALTRCEIQKLTLEAEITLSKNALRDHGLTQWVDKVW